MRQIKFRGKTLKEGKWIFGNLTEDILLKAGATKIGEKLYKFRHAFIIHETSSCFVIRMESEEGRFWNVMPFSYLHQLQNIYRLCMNQDLKVDL